MPSWETALSVFNRTARTGLSVMTSGATELNAVARAVTRRKFMSLKTEDVKTLIEELKNSSKKINDLLEKILKKLEAQNGEMRDTTVRREP